MSTDQTMPNINEALPDATTESAKDIKPINKDTVHRICSGQVVLNLGVAVKELVENSIDAGATLVEVRLREQGLDQIEVIDNGWGVDEANFEGLTAKYHTSKIREFADLAGVTTFGFRGEALSSLCALSDMIVTTRHRTANVATRLELDHRGAIVKRAPCARQTGTTITMNNLFTTLPVRKREFTKNIRKEFTRMCQIMQGYGLVARGVRIICTNQTQKGAKTTVMATGGSQSYLENITAIFGPKQKVDLMELRTTDAEEEENGFKIEGWISSCSHGSGRSTRDRQYLYVNERPCEPKQLIKVINEVYHRYNMQQSPFVFLNVVVARRQVDVNLTPDKRQVLVNNEQLLIEVLKTVMLRTFGDVPSTFKMQNLDVTSRNLTMSRCDQTANETVDDLSGENLTPNPNKFSSMLSQWRRPGQSDAPCEAPKVRPKRKGESNDIGVRNVRLKSMHDYLQRAEGSESDRSVDSFFESQEVEKQSSEDMFDEFNTPTENEINPKKSIRIVCATDTPTANLKTISADSPSQKMSTALDVRSARNRFPSCSPQSSSAISRPETPTPSQGISPIRCVLDESGSDDEPDSILLGFKSQATNDLSNELSITVTQIETLMLAEAQQQQQQKQRKLRLERLRFKAAIDPTKNNAAEQELETEISKTDFRRMEIIGQFNLGFIVVRLDDDLFIVDQHASDEKYNFETLQLTTQLQNQPMVRAQPLDLTAVNEMVLIDNRRVFEMNGFKFEIDETAEPTHKCKLVAKPFSKNWEFGKEDIDELIFMLQDCPGNSAMCRPSRIRAMFASRACRKSVMVGTALTVPKMKRLVEQMGEIEHPWNCPHGRPTMRHLLNLAMLEDVAPDNSN